MSNTTQKTNHLTLVQEKEKLSGQLFEDVKNGLIEAPLKNSVSINVYYHKKNGHIEPIFIYISPSEISVDAGWSSLSDRGQSPTNIEEGCIIDTPFGKYELFEQEKQKFPILLPSNRPNSTEKKKYTAYTPAPWKNTLTGIKDSKGNLIAQAWCGDTNESFGNHPAVTYTEMNANNSLIATAPELLESLEEVLMLLEIYAPIKSKGNDFDIYQRAKAAILKAKK